MDFSVKPIEHGVVDSPPDGGKRLHHVNSPSPLKSHSQSASPTDPSNRAVKTQRKLYDHEVGSVAALEV